MHELNTVTIENGQDIIDILYELEYIAREIFGDKSRLKHIISGARTDVQFTKGIEKLWIKVELDGDVIFEGHQGHFADNFFDNAHQPLIEDWGKENGYTLEFKMSVENPWKVDG